MLNSSMFHSSELKLGLIHVLDIQLNKNVAPSLLYRYFKFSWCNPRDKSEVPYVEIWISSNLILVSKNYSKLTDWLICNMTYFQYITTVSEYYHDLTYIVCEVGPHSHTYPSFPMKRHNIEPSVNCRQRGDNSGMMRCHISTTFNLMKLGITLTSSESK